MPTPIAPMSPYSESLMFVIVAGTIFGVALLLVMFKCIYLKCHEPGQVHPAAGQQIIPNPAYNLPLGHAV